MIRAYVDRKEEQSEQMVSQAWINAYLSRVEKFPSYSEFIGKKEEKEPQTDEQMLNTVKALHYALGGD